MKLLAIDSGNSRIKWGLYEDGGWTARDVVTATRSSELGEQLRGLAAPDRILIAHVGGEQGARDIARALERFAASPTWIMSRHEQCGVRSSYAEPAQLGPDRWAALIGAHFLYDGPAVVVNAGTTLTVDALTSAGIFLGGFIVPGYTLMRESLSHNTARLKLQEGGLSFFPDNTGDAIASGAANALAGAIDRMTRYMKDAGEGDAMVLLSGGDAAILQSLLSASVQVVDNLVLEGIARIGVGDV